MFQDRDDRRAFMAQFARAVRRGEIEVHAIALLDTHFHGLVRSPQGNLAGAMRRVENVYVRRFNRKRRRDGPLVRGRFWSRRVWGRMYRYLLVRYIDDNPIAAGLAADAREYEFSSAAHYAKPSGPPWLCRSWVESVVVAATGVPYDPARYAEVFPSRLDESFRRWVDRRLAKASMLGFAGDSVASLPPHLLARHRYHAALADGIDPVAELVPPDLAIEACARAAPDLPPEESVVLTAGVLRDLCDLQFDEIAAALSLPTTTARRRVFEHRKRVDDHGDHLRRARHAVALAVEALRRVARVPAL